MIYNFPLDKYQDNVCITWNKDENAKEYGCKIIFPENSTHVKPQLPKYFKLTKLTSKYHE